MAPKIYSDLKICDSSRESYEHTTQKMIIAELYANGKTKELKMMENAGVIPKTKNLEKEADDNL